MLRLSTQCKARKGSGPLPLPLDLNLYGKNQSWRSPGTRKYGLQKKWKPTLMVSEPVIPHRVSGLLWRRHIFKTYFYLMLNAAL